MATRKTRKRQPHTVDRRLIEQLMFGTGRVRRFTQDSPVLPDVWLEYARGPGNNPTRLTGPADESDPFPAVKLLLTPYRQTFAGEVRQVLRRRLQQERKTKEWQAFGHAPEPLPRLVYNQSTVAATLYFEDLIRVVLPMTDWWARLERQWRVEDLQTEEGQEVVAEALKDPEHPRALKTGQADNRELRLPPALLWMMRVAGVLAIVHRGRPLPRSFQTPDGVASATTADWRRVVEAIAELVHGVKLEPQNAHVYSISLNREANTHDCGIVPRGQGRRRPAAVRDFGPRLDVGRRR